ncbi:MAG: hypothetical protein LRY27_04260, partial [Chitinophagales bacterium]|nr:hypothetical protein [Chitinophagales bacterium]
MKHYLLLILLGSASSGLFSKCNGKNHYENEKGLSIEEQVEHENDITAGDSALLYSRPTDVILTHHNEHRLLTIHKINYSKDKKSSYTASNSRYYNYADAENGVNNWHYNYLPGLEAMYSYNLIGLLHFNTKTNETRPFFNKPVLINSVYYPAIEVDTLNRKLVERNYYMVSVYDEDTNQDSVVNMKDLRHFYLFDLNANL